jgi:hypothetical protein
VPVLLLTFNRPTKTALVLDQISHWKIPRLYVAGDGPRPEVAEDVARCQAVRRLIESLDVPYPIDTWFRDRNAGCGVAVSEAISWFFDHEPVGIILEDDCVPHPSFLPYCAELLGRYHDTSEVMSISGNNFLYEREVNPTSYGFIRHPLIWGWATWRYAWQHFDFGMREWPQSRSTNWLSELCLGQRDAVRYWESVFEQTYRNEIDSWAYRWTYACWRQRGLSIIPGMNMVDNIGFGASATHTTSRPAWLDRVRSGDMNFPLEHPGVITQDRAAEGWIDRTIFNTKPPLHNRVKHRVKLMLAGAH